MHSFPDFLNHARVVNRMVIMHASHPLCLPEILPKLPHARYNRARPCRIYWRYEDRVPIQLFPKGTVQILGGKHDDCLCDEIRDFLMKHLSIFLSPPRLRSCTVSCRLAQRFPSLTAIPSNHCVINEYEIFPGTLIQQPVRNRHYHVCLFPNGTAIVTGVRSLTEAYHQLRLCLSRYNIQ